MLLAGYGLPLLVGKIAVVPGGLGVVEGGMVGMYHALGLPAATAVTVVLAYRLLSFWLPNLVGFAVMPWLEAAPHRAPSRRPRHPARPRSRRRPPKREPHRNASFSQQMGSHGVNGVNGELPCRSSVYSVDSV